MRKLINEPPYIQPDSGAAPLGQDIGCLWRAEICLLIKNPQTGEPIDLEAFHKHFAAEIATGAAKTSLLVGDRIIASILGRDGGLLDDRDRLRLAMFFAKTQMGWTVAKRPKLVCDPIDEEDARELDDQIARLARGLKAEGTGGSSAG